MDLTRDLLPVVFLIFATDACPERNEGNADHPQQGRFLPFPTRNAHCALGFVVATGEGTRKSNPRSSAANILLGADSEGRIKIEIRQAAVFVRNHSCV
jgi:hypothetical protein